MDRILKLLEQDAKLSEKELAVMCGKTEEQIHSASHFPEKAYGIPHFFPSVRTGRKIAQINVLRTEIRDCERQAVSVYKDGFPAFIRALNRLSSYAYCLMCEQKAKQEEEI